MSTQVRVYDMEDGHPCVVMVVSGTFDVSRLAGLLASGRCEDHRTAGYIRRTLSRHRGGRAALKLLRDHGGPDLVVGTAPSDEPSFLIWSFEHNLWHKANGAGYTSDLWSAGRYAKDGAERVAWHEKDVVVLAPEYGMDAMTVEEIRVAPKVMEQRIAEAMRAQRVEDAYAVEAVDRGDAEIASGVTGVPLETVLAQYPEVK